MAVVPVANRSQGRVRSLVDADRQTTLVGQYRYVLEKFSWEVPAGGGAFGVPALDSARRELLEETGYRTQHWLHLLNADFSPGNTSEHMASSRGACVPAPRSRTELLITRRLPFGEAVRLALSGEIASYQSIALLLAVKTRARRQELPTELLEILNRK
jgi:8-oxo-dGTP pyrophosphatase MutT (NUDIX family)